MDYYFHSQEVSKVKIEGDFNIQKLNHFEIMGLYLLGFIEFIELKNTFKTDDPFKLREMIDSTLDRINDKYKISNEQILKNFVE